MADMVRTPTDLITNLFQDGQTAGITAQDMRDLIVSLQNPYGGLYFSTPVVTPIAVQDTFYKALGTTTITNAFLVDNGGVSNRLRYTGTVSRHFHIVLQASISFASGTNQVGGIQLWKYDDSGASGALLAHSQAKAIVAGTDVAQITSHADAMLDTNDYIELHIANHDGTNNITVDLGYVFMVGMFGDGS